jgi:hypothetical protein
VKGDGEEGDEQDRQPGEEGAPRGRGVLKPRRLRREADEEKYAQARPGRQEGPTRHGPPGDEGEEDGPEKEAERQEGEGVGEDDGILHHHEGDAPEGGDGDEDGVGATRVGADGGAHGTKKKTMAKSA